jgi:hypothetical protein
MPKYLTSCIAPTIASLRGRICRWTRPSTPPILGYVLDRFRSPEDLGRENALLRKQLEVACRQIARRPRFTRADRLMLVLLARLAPTWQSATRLVRPETILRWHRQGFQLFWRRKSKRTEAQPRISAETITLIEQMARNNRLWGAERIRGELLKLDIRVAKRTIQKYMRRAAEPRPPGQRWSTFLRNHAHETWACDFLQTCDLLFRPIFAFFVIAIGSRRVVHVGVTRSPSSAWVAPARRRLGCRPALPDSRQRRQVRYAIDEVAVDRNQDPAHARPSAERERVLRALPAQRSRRVPRSRSSAARDHPDRLRRYCAYFNNARPHQGIGQKIPIGPSEPRPSAERSEIPILGGLPPRLPAGCQLGWIGSHYGSRSAEGRVAEIPRSPCPENWKEVRTEAVAESGLAATLCESNQEERLEIQARIGSGRRPSTVIEMAQPLQLAVGDPWIRRIGWSLGTRPGPQGERGHLARICLLITAIWEDTKWQEMIRSSS